MALNKKERLFKEIKTVFDNLDIFFTKVKKRLDIVYIKGYQQHPIVDCPLMSYDNFWTMCNTYKTALSILSNDNEKKEIFKTKDLTCTPFHPKVILKSQILVSHKDSLESDKWIIPWKFEIDYPKNLSASLNKSKKRASLYCASNLENTQWLDFYDKEDEADSLTNIILSIGNHPIEKAILNNNLKSSSLKIFEKLFEKKMNKDIYEVAIKDFEITETTTVEECYLKSIKPINSIKEGDYIEILELLTKELKMKIFENLNWSFYQKKDFLNNYFGLGKIKKTKFNKKSRWDSDNSISRDDCANLIEYFYIEYKKDPIKRYYLGETLCIIWLLIWSTQEFETEISVKEIVNLESLLQNS